jgi:8-oxo-dGTP pyrophosphatase MutT (NUDIX family)
MQPEVTTLCYLERDGQYLMLHRVKKEHDVNKDKWIGVGGHAEEGESPEDCVIREVREETGLTLTSYRLRGVVTFLSGKGDYEYMFLFTASGWSGEETACDEGDLEWVDKDKVWDLNIWEGDKIFFRLLDEDASFFSLKLVYDGTDRLERAVLNGTPMELFDIIEPDGTKTGARAERGVVHRDGRLHGTAHIWIVRPNRHGSLDYLLQKRSMHKDSYPGCYDISSAGHVQAGESAEQTALREVREELGIDAAPEDLHFVGIYKITDDAYFYGRKFRDRERSSDYVMVRDIPDEDFHLQADEVDGVRWMDYDELREAVAADAIPNCIHLDEIRMVKEYVDDRHLA